MFPTEVSSNKEIVYKSHQSAKAEDEKKDLGKTLLAAAENLLLLGPVAILAHVDCDEPFQRINLFLGVLVIN